jgi:predicted nicotinamide N-methyase
MLTHTPYDMLVAPWTVHAIFAAVRLKVFTVLSDRRMTAEEVAAECGAVPRLLKTLLDVCLGIGLLTVEGDAYGNSDFSRAHLVEGERQYVGDLIQVQHSEFRPWYRLHEMIAGKDAGKADVSTGDPGHHRTFIRAMNNLGMLGEADALRDAVDLSGCRTMVDAGGGSGLYSAALCQRYPKLRSTLLDRTETLDVTRELIADRPEKDRITLREADITTDTLGENVDVVLLSDVIYDEAEAVAVLKNAWNCLREGGQLLVRGYYWDEENSRPLFGALFMLNVMIFDAGRRVLTLRALCDLITAAGFRIDRVSPLTERSTVLVATK